MKDTLANAAFWVMIPTVRITERCPWKWVRVLGLLAAFLLVPLVFIGLPILAASVVVGVFKDI